MPDERQYTDPTDESTAQRASPTAADSSVDDNAVKAALARLARGGGGPDPTESPAAVVEEAVAATGRLADAAAFVTADGRERLATAVDRLEARDRTVTADRGAAVLADLAAFRDAADPGPDGDAEAGTGTTSAPPTERI